MRFEWDERKNRASIRKHGVDFEQAAYAFSDPFAWNTRVGWADERGPTIRQRPLRWAS
jgi:uncharacterized DUF497 family protein